MAVTIDKDTRISLFAIATCVPFAVGAIIWLSSIHSVASSAQAMGEKNSTIIDHQTAVLHEIRERLVRIEQMLRDKK